MTNAPYMLDRWFVLLSQAVDAHPRRIAGVAEAIGYSRQAVSMVMSGGYQANPDKVARAVLDQYDRLRCPHLGEDITPAQCGRYARRVCPTTNPSQVRHWRACQTCPNKPSED